MTEDYSLRYPIGKLGDQLFTGKQPFDEQTKKRAFQDIKFLPLNIENAVLNLDAEQLQVPYREGGWTIQQVVHHVADSHMNAFTRMKLGLTEDNPTIKPYEEAEWAKLADATLVPINVSITLLHALHVRMFTLLNSLTPEQWQRTVSHPANNRTISLWEMLATYAWHGKHHLAHITGLRDMKGWN